MQVKTLEQVKLEYIKSVVGAEAAAGRLNQAKLARALNINRNTLANYIKQIAAQNNKEQ